MKKTYHIASDAWGWTSRTWLSPDRVFDEIASSAKYSPVGYLGPISERALAFEGVTVRIDDFHHPSGYKVNVEITNKDLVRQEFYELWMKLVDEGVVMGEPSERIPFDTSENAFEKELDHFAQKWNDRGYTRKKGYPMEEWMTDEEVPTTISPKKLSRRASALRGKKKKTEV